MFWSLKAQIEISKAAIQLQIDSSARIRIQITDKGYIVDLDNRFADLDFDFDLE